MSGNNTPNQVASSSWVLKITYAEVGENCKVGEFVSSILAGTKHFAWLNIPIVRRADLQILKFPIICATFEEIIETMATQNIDKL